MSGRKQNSEIVVAILKQLAVQPKGAENVSACHDAGQDGMDSKGRSELAAPLPGADRPTLTEFYQLERENQLLIDHVEMLACALGACPNCWGNIPDCEDCGGMGKPGAYNPDPACFDRFVRPVVNRMMGERFEIHEFLRSRKDLRNPHHPQGTSV